MTVIRQRIASATHPQSPAFIMSSTIIKSLVALTLISATTASPILKTRNWGPSLRDLSGKNNLRYLGTASQAADILDDPMYAPLLEYQFSAITPENEMKWEVIEPTEGVFNWTGSDIASSPFSRHPIWKLKTIMADHRRGEENQLDR